MNVTIRVVFSLEAGLQALLTGLWPVSSVESKLDRIVQTQERIMKTLDEFQAKLDLINENTTASATAAGHVAQTLTDLKAELDQALTDAGLPADQEAAILAKLTAAADTTTALRTFLEATAAGPSEPTPVPTPEPTPTPSPVE